MSADIYTLSSEYRLYGDLGRRERIEMLLADAVVTRRRQLALRDQLRQEVPELTDAVCQAIEDGVYQFDVLDKVNEV